MTALPLPSQPLPLQHLLTVAEYAALPEDTDFRYELEEGVLVMSPRPRPRHQRCIREIGRQLDRQLPAGLDYLAEIDIDLQLAAPDEPGFVRVPDLVVVPNAAYDRVDREGGLLRATDVVLGIEILSPGTRRRDTRVKHAEYADARIPHYWILDVRDRVTLTPCHLTGELGYADPGPVIGTFVTDAPFPVRIELDRLV